MILDAPGGKVLTYLLTIFSAIEASKAVSKRRPESDELEILSTEAWDTFKARVLAKISKNLAPRFLDFNDYKIMYFIPRLVPKPGRQLTTADNYASLLKLLEKSSNKAIPAINVVIEQKTTDNNKENTTASAESNTTKDHGNGQKKVCSSIHLSIGISDHFIEEEGHNFAWKRKPCKQCCCPSRTVEVR